MSTSADPRPVRRRAVAYADPVAQHLVERVQQEYVVRYGGRDAAVVDPAEFAPPLGLFLVAEVEGRPAGCGGWRSYGDGVAEVKPMYVEPAFRRRGIAALVLTELERSAAAAGHRELVLNSGDRQPEALALDARAGCAPVAGYGVYADAPGAVFLGKSLGTSLGEGRDVRATGEEDDAWAS